MHAALASQVDESDLSLASFICKPKVGVLEKLDISLSAMMSPNFVLLRRVNSRLVGASQVKSLDIKVPPLDWTLC